MDDRSFDRLARLLGEARDRRTGLKALVGGILGTGTLAALAADTDAKRRKKKKRKKCDPPCAAGQTCVKGTCTCASGIACGAECCSSGQVCRDGACTDPLPACLAFGAACKDTGRACCDGLTCASSQDGSFPVTCLRAKDAACVSTAECPYGMACSGGRCVSSAALPTGASCGAGSTCAQPGATCTAYTTPGSPAGTYCALPLRRVCTGNAECACFNCWYVQDGVQVSARQSRDAAPAKACVEPKGAPCATDADCARGLTCDRDSKTCTGTSQCVPPGGPCAEGPCCGNAACSGGVCGSGPSCTIERSAFASDADAGAALKAIIENGTLAEITIGPGTYKPSPDTGQIAGLVIDRNVTVKACDPANKPVLDGGAKVTGAADANAEDLTWENGVGHRIAHVKASRTVVIDGVDFQNAFGADDDYGYGGAIVSEGALTLRDLKISRSTADNGYGGGLYIDSENETRLEGVEISQSYAGDYGGGLCVGSVPKLTVTSLERNGRRSLLSNNYAGYGGGLYTDDYPTDVFISYTDVKNNVSAYEGGGLYLQYSNVTIDQTLISENQGSDGGGIYSYIYADVSDLAAGPFLTITNTTIEDNIATSSSFPQGGGIYSDRVQNNSYVATVRLGDGTIIRRNGADGIYTLDGRNGAVTCTGTATICGDPPTGSVTGATNCAGQSAGYTGCSTACVGGGPGGSGNGACPTP